MLIESKRRKPKVEIQSKGFIDALIFRMNLSSAVLAPRLGVHQTQISNYRAGRLIPSVKVAKRLQLVARECGIEVSLDEIYADIDPKEVDPKEFNKTGNTYYD